MTRYRIDPLGALVTAVGAAALLWLPFAVLKPNRILPGDALSLIAVLPPSAAIACLATLILVALAALVTSKPRVRLAAALLGVIVVAAAIATAGNVLTPPGNRVVRVAPGSGFWVLLVAVGLMATDAITRLRPRPAARVLMLALFAAVTLFALARGTFDHLSVMREYAVNAGRSVHRESRLPA